MKPKPIPLNASSLARNARRIAAKGKKWSPYQKSNIGRTYSPHVRLNEELVVFDPHGYDRES